MDGGRDDVITVVTGLPRSGTSVMMRMLAAAGLAVQTDALRAADADNPHGYFEDERVKQLAKDSSWLVEARGKVVKVVVPLLLLLPSNERYRIVFVERDLDEVLDSQQTMIRRLGREGANLPRERLKQVFAGQISRVKEFVEGRGMPVLYVAYRDVMADAPGVAERVSVFLGGRLDTVAMAGVVDPKLGRHGRG